MLCMCCTESFFNSLTESFSSDLAILPKHSNLNDSTDYVSGVFSHLTQNDFVSLAHSAIFPCYNGCITSHRCGATAL